MPNYQNGKIYKICTYNSDDVYYGSTCLKLCQRLTKHVYNWKHFNENKKNVGRLTSFSILDQGNYYIELVENVQCSSKEELHKRERFWLKNNPCVNLCKNLVSTPEEKKEQGAMYYQQTKPARRDWGIQYRSLNKEALREYRKSRELFNEYVLCNCGRYYKRRHLSCHNKTVFHKENINKVMFSQFLDL